MVHKVVFSDDQYIISIARTILKPLKISEILSWKILSLLQPLYVKNFFYILKYFPWVHFDNFRKVLPKTMNRLHPIFACIHKNSFLLKFSMQRTNFCNFMLRGECRVSQVVIKVPTYNYISIYYMWNVSRPVTDKWNSYSTACWRHGRGGSVCHCVLKFT